MRRLPTHLFPPGIRRVQVQQCQRRPEPGQQSDYSAILLDIKMPEMDGCIFWKPWQREARSAGCAHDRISQHSERRVGNSAGASDYVTKPFTPEEISQAVHRLLHHGADDAAAAPATSAAETPSPTTGFHFFRDAWFKSAPRARRGWGP